MLSFSNHFKELKNKFIFSVLFIHVIFIFILFTFDLIMPQGVWLLSVLLLITLLFFINFFQIYNNRLDLHNNNIHQTLLENIPKGIMLTNKFGVIEYVNKYFEKITLYSSKEVIGKNANVLKSGHHTQKFYEKLWNKIQNEGFYNGEVLNRKKNGEVYPQRVSITALYTKGQVNSYIAIFSDISEEKEVLEKLKKQKRVYEQKAHTDHLTKIYNRGKFDNILEYEYKKYQRYKEPFCLIFLDIDCFKSINDKFGHDVGDNVLVQLSHLISHNIRQSDTFARWGGEEFVILLSQTQLTVAYDFANNLRETIKHYSFTDVNQLTVSMGVVEFNENQTLEAFIKKADMALYLAKENGRNRVESIQ
ncbi:MAG: sensor domain-containing diguanylate cyclase [Sulfurimonadaceae bacterium]